MKEECFDSSEEIYDGLDTLFSPRRTTSCGSSNDACSCFSTETEMPTETWMDEKDILVLPVPSHSPQREGTKDGIHTIELDSTSCHNPFHQDAKLKKVEMDLYVELMTQEMQERQSKYKLSAEYEELRKEVIRLKNLNSEKDAMLSELTMQNTNLKKNICSLYKTAKAEVDQKTMLLQEANKKLDRIHYYQKMPSKDERSHSSVSHSNKNVDTGKSEVKTKGSNYKSSGKSGSDTKHHGDTKRSPQKRKRSCSPPKEDSSHHSNHKQSRKEIDNSHTQKATLNLKQTEVRTLESDSKSTVSSRDLTETNNIFFSILPDALKHSFLEYEQNQIVTLNKLKQSFVSNYFTFCKNKQINDVNSVKSSVDSVHKSSSNTKAIDSSPMFFYKQGIDLKNSLERTNHIHSGNDTQINSSSNRHYSDEYVESEKDNSVHLNDGNRYYNNDGTCSQYSPKNAFGPRPVKRFSATSKTDVITLYRYRKEKLPFLLKRKLGFFNKQITKSK